MPAVRRFCRLTGYPVVRWSTDVRGAELSAGTCVTTVAGMLVPRHLGRRAHGHAAR